MGTNGSEAGRTFNRDRFAGVKGAGKGAVLGAGALWVMFGGGCGETPTYGPDKKPLQTQSEQSGQIGPGAKIKIVGSSRPEEDWSPGEIAVAVTLAAVVGSGVLFYAGYGVNVLRNRMRRK